MMKRTIVKSVLIFFIIAMIALCAAYRLAYPLKLDINTLPGEIVAFYNKGDSLAIEVYDGVEVGNRAYYLIELGEKLGSVTLEKGLNGRYRFTHLGYGDGDFLDGIVEYRGEKYLLFGGRDLIDEISGVSISIDGQTYDLSTTKEAGTRFFICMQINGYTQDTHINRDNVSFFNDKGENITKLYDLSGGGIQWLLPSQA